LSRFVNNARSDPDRALPDPPGFATNNDSDAIQHPLGMTAPAIDLFPLGFFEIRSSEARLSLDRSA